MSRRTGYYLEFCENLEWVEKAWFDWLLIRIWGAELSLLKMVFVKCPVMMAIHHCHQGLPPLLYTARVALISFSWCKTGGYDLLGCLHFRSSAIFCCRHAFSGSIFPCPSRFCHLIAIVQMNLVSFHQVLSRDRSLWLYLATVKETNEVVETFYEARIKIAGQGSSVKAYIVGAQGKA